MGRRSCSQKKSIAMLDGNDIESMVSCSSSVLVDNIKNNGLSPIRTPANTPLDRCLDDLYEKRGSTREQALASIIESFNKILQHEFVETKFATLLHLCLNSIKNGSAKEVELASHAIGLLALTAGPGEKSREILQESVSPISDALKIQPETAKISLLHCLAIITFVNGKDDPERTEKSMLIMWRVAHPELGPDAHTTSKPSTELTKAAVSAWSFLLATMDVWAVNHTTWQESISYLCTLLDNTLHMAAGEALALIFEMGSLEKFSCIHEHEDKLHGLKSEVVGRVRGVCVEACGKVVGSTKKGRGNQRHTFGDILDFLETGSTRETSVNTGGGSSLNTTSWAQRIQLYFLKDFLGGGLAMHMKQNQYLHRVFGIMPKKETPSEAELCMPEREKEKQIVHFDSGFLPRRRITAGEKRMYKSPNSVFNKARTKQLNRQRKFAQDMNMDYFAFGADD